MTVTALLFDSGGTLVRPTASTWMPGSHFEAFAAAKDVTRDSHPRAWAAALHAGNAVLVGEPVVPTVDEEAALFAQYFAIVSRSLGLPAEPAAMRALANETVFGAGQEECFDGVVGALDALRLAGMRLLLLANGWPSLSRRYRELGLRDHFEFFVTSTQLGIKKPSRRVFRLVSEITNVAPENLLVVDDLAANVLTGVQLGMPGVLVTGGTEPTTPGLDHIEAVMHLPQWLNGIYP